MALLRLNKKDREMVSSLARQQKFAAGQSQIDHHINCILLQSSLRRPSVSFAPVQKAGAGDPGSNKVKSSTILGASTASSKMVCTKFTPANRISGSAIMKSTGLTWMCKSPKYDEKGFPNHVYDVIDTSIMRLVPDHDFEIPTEPEFEMLIKSAHPKPEPDNILPDGDDVKACFENETCEVNVNVDTDIDEVYDIGLFFEVCNQVKKKDFDEVYDIGLFFEVCNQTKKKDIDEVYDIGLFFEVCNQTKKENVDEVYDIGLFFKVCNQVKKETIDEVYDIGLFFEVCNQQKQKDIDEVYDIGLLFDVCNQINKEDVDEVFDIGLFFEVCNQQKEKDMDEVYDIGLFFEVCNRIKKKDVDEVYGIGLFFELCNQIKKENVDEVYDIGLFFELCNQQKKKDIDEVYDIGLFFEVCNQIKKKDIDEVYDIGLFFEVCEQLKKEDIDDVFNSGSFFEACDIKKTKEFENDKVSIFDPNNHKNEEETHIAPLPRLDENMDCDEDVFGILGVFCRSGLHFLGSGVQEISA